MNDLQPTPAKPTHRAARVVIVAAVMLVLVACLWMWKTPTATDRVPKRQEVPTVQLQPAFAASAKHAPQKSRLHPTSNHPTLGLHPGDRLDYEFQQERTLALSVPVTTNNADVNAVVSSAIDATVRQSGRLQVCVYGEDPRGWNVGFRLAQPRVERSGALALGLTPSNEVDAALGQEIMTFVQKSGRIDKIVTPSGLPAETRNHWRDILARWQVILPDSDADQTWNREEEDSTGTCLAKYTRLVPLTEWHISKQRDHYVRLMSVGCGPFSVKNAITGATVIALDPYPVSIEGNEAVCLADLGFGHRLTTRAVFSFRLVQAEKTGVLDNAIVQQAAALLATTNNVLSWAGEATFPHSSVERKPVARVDVECELDRLGKLLSNCGVGSSEQVRSMETIRDLVRQDDTVVDAILDGLTDGVPDSDYAATLIGVLGAAGTPAAQVALLHVLTTADWPEAQKQMALFAFAQVTDPIPELDAWLQSLHQSDAPLAGNALLILGAMGDRVRTSDPERYARISDYVVQCASIAGLPENNLVIGLDALGNLGPSTIPSCVETAAASGSSILRQHALLSLQRVHNELADGMLIGALVGDSANDVRTTAAKLLGDNARATGLDALAVAAAGDVSAAVRKQALVSLGEWSNTNPTAGEAIRTASIRDPDLEIRELAKELLSNQVEE